MSLSEERIKDLYEEARRPGAYDDFRRGVVLELGEHRRSLRRFLDAPTAESVAAALARDHLEEDPAYYGARGPLAGAPQARRLLWGVALLVVIALAYAWYRRRRKAPFLCPASRVRDGCAGCDARGGEAYGAGGNRPPWLFRARP